MLPDNLPSLLFATLVIFLAGAVVFAAVVREPHRYFPLERIAYCYPLGLAVLSLPLFLLSWMDVSITASARCLLIVVILAAVAVGFIRRPSLRTYWMAPGPLEDKGGRLSEFEWFLLVMILVCLGARMVASLLAPLNDWDGIVVWGLKAKALYYETLRSTHYFDRAEFAYSHTKYPLLWPFMYAWMCAWAGQWDDLGMMLLNPINLIVFTALLYFTLRKQFVRMIALGVTGLMVSLPPVLHYTECGQADVPLMLISGASLFCLFDWMQRRRTESLWLAALMMGGAMFTKQEGLVLLGSNFCAAILSVWLKPNGTGRGKLFARLVLYAAIALLWVLPWLVFQRQLPDWDLTFRGIGLGTLRWLQIPVLLRTIVENALRWHNQVQLPKWHILWPILALCIASTKSCWRHPWVCLLVVFVLHAAGVSIIFLASRWDVTFQNSEIAFERFAMVMLVPLWLVLANCIDEWWRVWNSPVVSETVSDSKTQNASMKAASVK
jgi:4-amino-4-deoxy-L-arabinose transferase-like glycosyltransferase